MKHRTLSRVVAGLFFLAPSALMAQSTITFQYDTVIDTTQVGGGPGTPLRVTYSFLSDLQPGSGQFGTTDVAAAYGPITLTLQIGAEAVDVSGPGNVIGIGVFNNAGTTFVEDGYGVASFPEATYSGQLFGLDVNFIDVHIIDSNLDMFSSTALPLTPDFASRADQSYVQITLQDASGNQILLSNYGQGAPFSLGLGTTAAPVCNSKVISIAGLHSAVDALHAGPAVKRGLNRLLNEVQVALDSGRNDDARNGLALFIRVVVNGSTRNPAQAGALILSEANQLVCSASNVVIGVPSP